MYRRKRILLLSSSIILLCVCLIAGATFALFTEDATVKTHLKAGNLDLVLMRESYSYNYLDNKGELADVSETDPKDFTDPSAENFFGFDDSTTFLMVPGSKFETVFSIGHEKGSGNVPASNTAFDFNVDIVLTENTDPKAVAFAKQLYVTIGSYDTDGNEVVWSEGYMYDGQFSLVDNLTNTDKYSEDDLHITIDEPAQKLFARVVFRDHKDTEDKNDDNNDAMQGDVTFDLFVTAVQSTTK